MRSRSSDPVAEALDAACARVVEAVATVGAPAPIVLIDGRSGAGKSSLARKVEQRWPLDAPAQRIELDWIYPGWDGLDEGARRAVRGILDPVRAGKQGSWHGWDWDRGVDLPEQHPVDPGRGIVLEGCGALTRESAVLADVLVWVESPDDVRKKRALDRDGDGFRAQWDRWAQQEAEHIAEHDPRTLATLVVGIP